jgi:hypothetical protein
MPSVHDEDQCTLVSTVGLSLICDQIPTYDGRQVQYGWNFNNQPGDIVFVKSTHLLQLCQYISHFKYPIIIVANGDDNYFPHDYQKHSLFEQLLSPRVLHVFAQNCWLRDHPKFHGIPIGIDYHTLNWESCNGPNHAWGPTNQSATQQEQQLLQVKSRLCSLPSLSSSSRTSIITNFHLAMNDPPRRRVMRQPLYEKLRDKQWMTWLPQQTRTEFWESLNNVAFVLCPPGNGPDTHRAWEVLALGRIPIIQDLSINSIYDDLPVWVVKDWNAFAALSVDDIQHKLDEFVRVWDTFNFDKLTLRWWTEHIHNYKKLAQVHKSK